MMLNLSTYHVTSGFFNVDTSNILDQIIPCWGQSVLCIIECLVVSLASTSATMTTKNVSKHCQMLPEGGKSHWLSIIELWCCTKSLQLWPTLCKPMTVARQAPLSLGLSRQEHWSGLSCLPPRDLSNSGIKPESLKCPALEDSLPRAQPEK